MLNFESRRIILVFRINQMILFYSEFTAFSLDRTIIYCDNLKCLFVCKWVVDGTVNILNEELINWNAETTSFLTNDNETHQQMLVASYNTCTSAVLRTCKTILDLLGIYKLGNRKKKIAIPKKTNFSNNFIALL